MTLRELIREIVDSKELHIEEKLDILEKLMNTGSILPNHYLIRTNEYEVECWYRYKNKNGEVERGNTGWDDPKQIINEYLKNSKEIKRRR